MGPGQSLDQLPLVAEDNGLIGIRITGDGLLPSGGRRHSQSGGAALTTFNEDSLNDGRAFQFSLFPNYADRPELNPDGPHFEAEFR